MTNKGTNNRTKKGTNNRTSNGTGNNCNATAEAKLDVAL
jgi:hypothetical protein